MKPVHPGLAGLQWRTLREEDIAEVAALEAQAHAAPWSPGNFRDALGAGYETCVGVRAGRVIAYGVLMLAPGEAQILNLTVAPEARGEGIGRELLRRFVVDAERVGAEQIFLEVRGSNVAAIGLYRAEGFAPVARREGYYPGATAGAPREDALVMRRAVVPVPSDDDVD
jgi:ribosomal-protein-alanine N-acetyltransferase